MGAFQIAGMGPEQPAPAAGPQVSVRVSPAGNSFKSKKKEKRKKIEEKKLYKHAPQM